MFREIPIALCAGALLLSGAASGKIYKEIPQALTWFRLGCYALVTVFFAIDLFKAV